MEQFMSLLAHVDRVFHDRTQLGCGNETYATSMARRSFADRFVSVSKSAQTVSICTAANGFVLAWRGPTLFPFFGNISLLLESLCIARSTSY